jgi:nicotinate dehydrogenase subunit A
MESRMPSYSLRVNGESRTVESRDPGQPLLYVLRNAFGLTGAKYGCGLAQCGACTVLVEGRAIRSCVIPVSEVAGKAITTIEGLGSPEKPHPLQAAFIAEQVPQCGYCTAGIVMTAAALLARTPKPSAAETKAALAGNLCRCGSHARVLKAVARVAGGTKA